MNNSLLIVLIASGIAYGTPLLYAALGELLAERSGVLNLGVEGMMLVGAVMGFWTVQRVHTSAGIALTAAILGSIEARQAGIGSAINNAVSRVAGLVAVAMLGIIVGSTLDVSGFHRGLVVTGALLIAGGVISAFGIRNLPRDAAPSALASPLRPASARLQSPEAPRPAAPQQ